MKRTREDQSGKKRERERERETEKNNKTKTETDILRSDTTAKWNIQMLQ
jgi:hypothetical protein